MTVETGVTVETVETEVTVEYIRDSRDWSDSRGLSNSRVH